MTEDEMEIVSFMEKYGGSFVKGLAWCFRYADCVNIEKLKRAFPEYWDEYREMRNEQASIDKENKKIFKDIL